MVRSESLDLCLWSGLGYYPFANIIFIQVVAVKVSN